MDNEKLIIISVIALIAIISLVVFLIILRNKKIRNEFILHFNLECLPEGTKIRKQKYTVEKNDFELSYPYWTFSNKDGTCDKRRNGNRIEWQYSYLYIENYEVRNSNPYYLVLLVNTIRSQNSYITISLCDEEKRKYSLAEKKKIFESKCNEINHIINTFKDNPTEFEEFTADLFRKMGYTANSTSKTNDGGYDVVVEKGKDKGIIECKCYATSHSVGRPLIQKLVGANQTANANRLIFITTSHYSSGAIAYAEEAHVELIDGNELLRLTEKYISPASVKISVNPKEWQLTYNDILNMVPSDIREYI